VRLPTATKTYRGLTIGVWDRAGGKDAFRRDAATSTIAEAVAKKIDERPNDRWLVVHHKSNGDFDFEKMVRARLTANQDNVSYLTWGRHDATNAFADVPNVILAGTLFMPEPAYEALGRASSAMPSSSGRFVDSNEVKHGEHAHGILQALCRAAVRGYAAGGCPSTRAYVIASRIAGIPQRLEELFPGARVVDWKPLPTLLRGNQRRAYDYILSRLVRNPREVVRFPDIARHLGIDPKNLKKTRNHLGFKEAIAAQGIEETQDGGGPDAVPSAAGFWHPFNYYFGTGDEG